MKLIKAMYGLKQSNSISEKQLKVRLAENGYHEVHPGTYRHESLSLTSQLMIFYQQFLELMKKKKTIQYTS